MEVVGEAAEPGLEGGADGRGRGVVVVVVAAAVVGVVGAVVACRSRGRGRGGRGGRVSFLSGGGGGGGGRGVAAAARSSSISTTSTSTSTSESSSSVCKLRGVSRQRPAHVPAREPFVNNLERAWNFLDGPVGCPTVRARAHSAAAVCRSLECSSPGSSLGRSVRVAAAPAPVAAPTDSAHRPRSLLGRQKQPGTGLADALEGVERRAEVAYVENRQSQADVSEMAGAVRERASAGGAGGPLGGDAEAWVEDAVGGRPAVWDLKFFCFFVFFCFEVERSRVRAFFSLFSVRVCLYFLDPEITTN